MNLNRTIALTLPGDVPLISKLIDEAIDFTLKNNYPVFPGHDKTVFQKDMDLKQQYKVIVGDDISVVFSVTYDDKLLWREKEIGNAIYLHRIVSNRKFYRQRQFQHILDWSIAHAKDKNRNYIRFDTWANNPKIIAYYQSFGFVLVENYTTPDNKELLPTHRNLSLALLQMSVS